MKISDMVVFSNRNINFPKYERFSVCQIESPGVWLAPKWKMAALPPSMSLIIKQQERSLEEHTRSALGHMSGSILRADLSLPRMPSTSSCDFSNSEVLELGSCWQFCSRWWWVTQMVWSLTLHIIYQSEMDWFFYAYNYKGPPVPVCVACNSRKRARAHLKDKLFHSLLYISIVSALPLLLFSLWEFNNISLHYDSA